MDFVIGLIPTQTPLWTRQAKPISGGYGQGLSRELHEINLNSQGNSKKTRNFH